MSAAPLCLSAGRYPPHRIWTHKYRAIATAVSSIGARQAYLDGELCGVRPDGVTSFSMIQTASDSGNAAALVLFLFDLRYLDGEDLCARPLIERKARLAALLAQASSPLHYCDHQIGLVVTWLPKVTLRKAFYFNVLSVYASRKPLKSRQTQLLQTRES
jgi:hypothetical protein